MQTAKVLVLSLLLMGIVGLAEAYTIQTENKGEAQITLTDETIVRTSRSYRDVIQKLVDDL